MKITKFKNRVLILLLLSILNFSCEIELTEYDTIALLPCEDINVVADNSVITDFECQSNVVINSIERIRNPSETGINTSKFVGKILDGASATDGLTIDLTSAISLSTNAFFELKIKSEITGVLAVRLKGGGLSPIEYSTTISGNNTWTLYGFDISGQDHENYTELEILFNYGVANNGNDIYYIDDLVLNPTIDPCEGVVPDLNIVSDFECQQNYFLGSDPTIETVPVIENPNPTAVNTSEFVGEYTDDGTQAWNALLIDYGSPIDLSTYNELKFKVLSSAAVPLLAKLEGGTNMEIWADITVVDEWVEYTFDFSGAAGLENTKLALFFNAGIDTGTAQDIYYIDDIRFTVNSCLEVIEDCTGVTQDLNIISDFDCQQNYFLGADSSQPTEAPVVQNPNVTCENQSSNVGEYTDDGTQGWNALIIDYGSPIDLSTHNQLKFKVLSSAAVPLLAKLEGGTPMEIWANITIVNEWVEYTFDFSEATGLNNTKLVLFFNAGVDTGTTQDIYYIDNIRFEEL